MKLRIGRTVALLLTLMTVLACFIGAVSASALGTGLADITPPPSNSGTGTGTGSGTTPTVIYGKIANVNSYVNFRSKASNTAARVSGCAKINKGETVEVLETLSGWYKVKYGAYTGYVSSAYLQLTSAPNNNSGNSGNSGSSGNSGTGTIGSSGTQAILTSADQQKVAAIPTALANAKSTNSDVRGWIYVPGTNVNYPVLYGKNFFYADHNINKKSETRGSIYTYTNAMTSITTISGHNSRSSGTMFHELHKWQDALLKNKNSNRICYISMGGFTKWEVFAMYEVPKDEPKTTERINTLNYDLTGSQKQAWIDHQIARSQINFGASVSAGEQIIVLMTCGDTYYKVSNGRLYIFLRAVG
ncbi:MAG: SH3 domain-containing protein [Bacillota bacterium]